MKVGIEVEAFAPVRTNTLRGFVTVVIPDLHLRIIDFCDRPTREAFSARVIAALLEFAPTAFDAEAAA